MGCKEKQFRGNAVQIIKVSNGNYRFCNFATKQNTLKMRFLLPIGIVLLLNGFINNDLFAQNVGIGFQVGDPTGLNLHFRNGPGAMHTDILFAWDLGDDDHDFFFVNVHGLWFKRLATTEAFNFYYGPGAFVGFRDHNRKKDNNDNEVVVGFSGNFGLNYEFSRFDIFLQVTPRLTILPGTDFDGGGGLGMRFFF